MIAQLNELGYNDIIQKTKNTFVIKVKNSQRTKALQHVSQELNAEYITMPSYISSIGYIKHNNFRIIAKPIEKQGDGSAGKINELALYDKLHKHITNYSQSNCIVFNSKDKEIVAWNVLTVENISNRSYKNRCKTDIRLIGDNILNLSVKKNNAQIWESADRYAADLVHTYIDHLKAKGLITMSYNNDLFTIKPNVAIECTESEATDVVFGSDVLGSGAVITQTFDDIHFTQDDNILYVNCESIVESIDELLPYQKPYFLIRNDCTRNCGYKGIRVLACYRSRITDTVLKFKIPDRVDI
jgi:hypothetical protein